MIHGLNRCADHHAEANFRRILIFLLVTDALQVFVFRLSRGRNERMNLSSFNFERSNLPLGQRRMGPRWLQKNMLGGVETLKVMDVCCVSQVLTLDDDGGGLFSPVHAWSLYHHISCRILVPWEFPLVREGLDPVQDCFLVVRCAGNGAELFEKSPQRLWVRIGDFRGTSNKKTSLQKQHHHYAQS